MRFKEEGRDMPETLDEIVEDLADKFGIYGCGPDDDHPTECKCRICYTIVMKDKIIDAVREEIKSEVVREEQKRIAEYLIRRYGGGGVNASRTTRYAVAKDLALELTLRSEGL